MIRVAERPTSYLFLSSSAMHWIDLLRLPVVHIQGLVASLVACIVST